MEILDDYLSEKGRKFSISSFFKDKTHEIERFNGTLDIKDEWEELKNEWDIIVENFVDEHPEVTVKQDFHNVDFNKYVNIRIISRAEKLLVRYIIKKATQEVTQLAEELCKTPTPLPKKKESHKLVKKW